MDRSDVKDAPGLRGLLAVHKILCISIQEQIFCPQVFPTPWNFGHDRSVKLLCNMVVFLLYTLTTRVARNSMYNCVSEFRVVLSKIWRGTSLEPEDQNCHRERDFVVINVDRRIPKKERKCPTQSFSVVVPGIDGQSNLRQFLCKSCPRVLSCSCAFSDLFFFKKWQRNMIAFYS